METISLAVVEIISWTVVETILLVVVETVSWAVVETISAGDEITAAVAYWGITDNTAKAANCKVLRQILRM